MEIVAANNVNENTNEDTSSKFDNGMIHLESVERIAKLPVVETTLQTGKSIYDRVKDYNSLTNWSVSTAESTMTKAVEIGKPYAMPVINTLEGPIKKVDGLMCSGLDYVESKIPAVKLPPGELYNNTKEYISSIGAVQTAKNYVEPAVQSARNVIEPAVEGAKHMAEPMIESAKHVIEPAVEGAKHLIEGSLETANAMKDYGVQKVGEMMGSNPKAIEEASEAEEDIHNAPTAPVSSNDDSFETH